MVTHGLLRVVESHFKTLVITVRSLRMNFADLFKKARILRNTNFRTTWRSARPTLVIKEVKVA
jgi:hypothetical protein